MGEEVYPEQQVYETIFLSIPGREAFSQFGQHFFDSLQELKEDFTKRRREDLGQTDAQTST